MQVPLEFKHQSERPTEPGDYLLFNQCDGFHIAYANVIDDEFLGFFNWLGDLSEYDDETYVAWARLPESELLYEMFADKPDDGKSAHDVTLERLATQRAMAAQHEAALQRLADDAQARRLPGGVIFISNIRVLVHTAPVSAGQMTLWHTDGQIYRGWIGIGGNAKQRRRMRRESQRAGYRVEMHAR